MQDYDDFDFGITIDRVKNALQRSTHLTNSYLWGEYPEFMLLWNEGRFLDELQYVSSSIKRRIKVILEPITTNTEKDFSEEAELFYLLDIIRDVKRQQPDKSLLEIIYDALMYLDTEREWDLESDEGLCELLSNYHDRIYQEQQKLKLENPGD